MKKHSRLLKELMGFNSNSPQSVEGSEYKQKATEATTLFEDMEDSTDSEPATVTSQSTTATTPFGKELNTQIVPFSDLDSELGMFDAASVSTWDSTPTWTQISPNNDSANSTETPQAIASPRTQECSQSRQSNPTSNQDNTPSNSDIDTTVENFFCDEYDERSHFLQSLSSANRLDMLELEFWVAMRNKGELPPHAADNIPAIPTLVSRTFVHSQPNCLSVVRGEAVEIVSRLSSGWSLCKQFNDDNKWNFGWLPTANVPKPCPLEATDITTTVRTVWRMEFDFYPVKPEEMALNRGDLVVPLGVNSNAQSIRARLYGAPFIEGNVPLRCFQRPQHLNNPYDAWNKISHGSYHSFSRAEKHNRTEEKFNIRKRKGWNFTKPTMMWLRKSGNGCAGAGQRDCV